MSRLSVESLAAAFRDRFGRAAETIARAPGRINLIGEHTDYNEGFVLPMAIDRATWAACAARRDDVVHVISDQADGEESWPINGWREGETRPHWTSYVAGVAALLRQRGAHLGGFEMLIASEVPPGAGLASSAALEVAVGKTLVALCGEPIDAVELAALCRRAEHEYAGVPCGIMDQYVSLLAKAEHALLLDCRSHEHEAVPLPLAGHAVVVIDSGVRHELAAGEFAERRRQCEAAVAYFRRLDPAVKSLRDVPMSAVRGHVSQMDLVAAARAMHVVSENERTQFAAAALRRGELTALGPLLAESHRSLRDQYEVSCPEVDQLVEIATRVHGVIGARMTGAGFGGAIIAIARESVIERLTAEVERSYKGPPARQRVLPVRSGPGASIELA